jgi:hypothetical protein
MGYLTWSLFLQQLLLASFKAFRALTHSRLAPLFSKLSQGWVNRQFFDNKVWDSVRLLLYFQNVIERSSLLRDSNSSRLFKHQSLSRNKIALSFPKRYRTS